MSEFGDSERGKLKNTVQIVQRLRQDTAVESRSMNCVRSREFRFDLSFIACVPPSTVVGKQRYFMIMGEMPDNVVGADLAPRVHRQQFPCFDPKKSHIVTSKCLRGCPPRFDGIFPGLRSR